MVSKNEFGEGTNIGLVRTNNEDSFLSVPENGLWLIADGMGGHDAGEVASQIVKDSVAQSIQEGATLKAAIGKSHADVKYAASHGTGSPNMGTTIISLLSMGNHYQIGWVGDSRAYLWDSLTNQLSRLSKDHSYVQALFDAGQISEEEIDTHPQKNIITQSLGVSDLDKVNVDIVERKWEVGQKVLLCSDGLTDLVVDSEISNIFRKNRSKSNQELVNTLIQAALDKGGVDNVSIQVISSPENLNELTDENSSSKNKTKLLAIPFITIVAACFYFFVRK